MEIRTPSQKPPCCRAPTPPQYNHLKTTAEVVEEQRKENPKAEEEEEPIHLFPIAVFFFSFSLTILCSTSLHFISLHFTPLHLLTQGKCPKPPPRSG